MGSQEKRGYRTIQAHPMPYLCKKPDRLLNIIIKKCQVFLQIGKYYLFGLAAKLT